MKIKLKIYILNMIFHFPMFSNRKTYKVKVFDDFQIFLYTPPTLKKKILSVKIS